MSQGNVSRVQNFVIAGFPGLPPSYHSLASALMFVIYVSTLMGNGIFFSLFAVERSLRKPMYYIMLNLAVCDVLFSTTTLPKAIAMYWFNSRDISFSACFFQMHFVHYFGSVNALVLGIMAFDRYVAVCHPLRYTSIVKDSTILGVCLSAWLVAEPFILTLVVRAYPLPYCGANTILQCYCDHLSITRLACTDRAPYAFVSLILSMTVLLTPLTFILFSYGCIIATVFRVSSARGRMKTLSTCSTQLLIISLFFLPRCLNYLSPSLGITYSTDIQILVVMSYSLLPPMINPIIYCLRTKEAKESLKKNLARSTFLQYVNIKVHVTSVCM